MASGLVRRANRPNTWLHRPACRREENPCQLGAVHTWHKADIPTRSINVRFWGEADMARPPLAYRSVAEDPKRRLRLTTSRIAASPDLILANAVCCPEIAGWGSKCN